MLKPVHKIMTSKCQRYKEQPHSATSDITNQSQYSTILLYNHQSSSSSSSSYLHFLHSGCESCKVHSYLKTQYSLRLIQYIATVLHLWSTNVTTKRHTHSVPVMLTIKSAIGWFCCFLVKLSLVIGSSHITLSHTSTPVFSVDTALLCFLPEHANIL